MSFKLTYQFGFCCRKSYQKISRKINCHLVSLSGKNHPKTGPGTTHHLSVTVTSYSVPIVLFQMLLCHHSFPIILFPLFLFLFLYFHCSISIVLFTLLYSHCSVPIVLFHCSISTALFPLFCSVIFIPIVLLPPKEKGSGNRLVSATFARLFYLLCSILKKKRPQN